MEYLQVTIKNAKRDDKGIIWRCRVQKSLTETRSSPAFFQCLCECSFPSAIPGSRCIKPRCCCWTGASPVPILGLPSQSHHGHWAAQSHSHCSSQNLPLLVRYSNSACTALAANAPWADIAGCASQRWGKWVQIAQGAQLAESHSLLISCELRGREAAQ